MKKPWQIQYNDDSHAGGSWKIFKKSKSIVGLKRYLKTPTSIDDLNEYSLTQKLIVRPKERFF